MQTNPKAISYLCKTWSLGLFLLFSTKNVHATHIVGGELTYQWKGGTTYEIRLDLYIDCLNGNAQAIAQDATAYIAFFDGKTGDYLSSITNAFNNKGITNNIGSGVARNGPVKLKKLNYNCVRNQPNACVDHYWYINTISLPARTGGYTISFQRCCRNNSINNLIAPEATGATYWTHIPNPAELPDSKPNSNAVFKERPPNFLCTNAPLRFDHSATDADGDSLVYELFQPYDGADQTEPRPDNNGNGTFAEPPFKRITWAGGYSSGYPINGSPGLDINRNTGYLTLTPTKVGQFVIGIRVMEYRKGKLIAESKRDYQFNVQSCIVDVVASYYNPIYICGMTYKFSNNSLGAQRYHWDFGISTATDDTSAQSEPTYTFPAPGKYKVKLYAFKSNCADTFEQTVEVVDPPKPKLPNDTLVCKNVSIPLSVNISGYSNVWSTGQTSNSITAVKPGLYWVESTLKTCKGRDSFVLKHDSIVVQLPKDTIVCSNNPIQMNISAAPGFKVYLWNTGHTTASIPITAAGTYILMGITQNNCVSRDTFNISKYPELTVNIRDTQICSGKSVTFDAVNPGCSYLWNTGETTQKITATAPGSYTVIVSRPPCVAKDDATITYFPDEMPKLANLRFCNTIDTVVNLPANNFKQISWNGNITNNYRITKPGNIIVEIINSNGCVEKDSFYSNLYPLPSLQLMNDTTVCKSVNPVLKAPGGMVSYQWQDGSNLPEKTAYDAGLYWVQVKDVNGCLKRDSVWIKKDGNLYPSMVYMPNAFTPDDNGINDVYPNNKYVNIGTLYNVKLYNRWGEKVAEFNRPDLNWDGSVNGRQAPIGVYVYLVTWIGCDNQRKTLRGDFTLIR